MPFDDSRITYENAKIEILYLNKFGMLSDLISQEEFDRLSKKDLKNLIQERAKQKKPEVRVSVFVKGN